MYYSRLRNLIVTSLILFLSLLFSSTNSAAQIRLAWNPNAESDLAGYRIHYGTTSRAYGTPIDVGNATSYTLTGLNPDIRYYFAVTAYDTEYHESEFSNEVSFVATDPQKTPLNDTGEFIKQLYRGFLNREADTEGLQYFVNQIDGGAMTKAQVVDAFLYSQEFEERIAPIVRLYFAYLLRIPDYGGLQYWINQYTNGTPLASISEAFTASQEFHLWDGSPSNGDFVTLLYQNVLGRSPDPPGYAYWVGQLSSGTQTRGQVMVGFSESIEFKGLTAYEVFVTMMYVGMLGRSPEQEGFDYWVEYLDSGNSEYSVIHGFLNSQEYVNRF